MKTETDPATQTPQEVVNELRALVAEAEKILGESRAGNYDGDCAASVAALRARFDAAQERLTEFYKDARRQVLTGAKYTDAAIRHNPYESAAVALGIGLIAGVLLGRRGPSGS